MVTNVEYLSDKSGYTRRHIRRLCSKGAIKAQQVSGVWVIDRKDADKWLASMKRKGV